MSSSVLAAALLSFVLSNAITVVLSTVLPLHHSEEKNMGIHFLAVAKLKLLAAGHAHASPLAALVWPFLLKLPLQGILSKLYADFAVSSTFFLFRLSQIVFQEQSQRNGRRWERALRLFRERVTAAHRASVARFESDEASFHQATMLAL